MIRYEGETLPEQPRIAVISNDALGNFVVTTPLLQMLRAKFKPSSLDYYGGVRTWELQADSDLFDFSFPLHGAAPSEQASIASERRGYDLVVNVEADSIAKIFAGKISNESTRVCGPCGDVPGHEVPFADDSRGDLWRDRDWTAEDLPQRYPFLTSGFIGEIFCRLAYCEGPIPSYKVSCEAPEIPVPPVLISTAGTVQEKLWPVENWKSVLSFLREQGHEVGLLGAHPIQQSQFWQGNDEETELVSSGLVRDLRGKLSLPQVVGALHAAKMVLTLDNGILHLSVAVQKTTVGIFREGIHRLWAPPYDCLTVLVPPRGEPVERISAEAVRAAVVRAL